MPVERFRKKIIEEGKAREWGDPIDNKPYTASRQDKRNVLRAAFLPPSIDTTPTTWPSTIAANVAQDCQQGEGVSGRNGENDSSDILYHDTARGIRQDPVTTTVEIETQADSSMILVSPLYHLRKMISTKGWDDLETVLSFGENFLPVHRVSALADLEELLKTIKSHEKNGVPLIIEGFQRHPKWPKDMFTLDNFVENTHSETVSVRNMHTWEDSQMSLKEFIHKCRSVTTYTSEDEHERFYGKDIDCPQLWEDWLQKENVVPSCLLENGSEDLLRFLQGPMSVQTLMCYLGVGDTYTPCHKDLCASSGQNLMCYTEDNGSSFWFMTESDVAPLAAKYFQQIKQELDHENHVLTIQELSKAPFNVYVLQQKLGDLVLVPPRSCHQVLNAGGITVKTSWSRMTSKGLSNAYYQELPIYRRLCRSETYRVKNMIAHTLLSQAAELQGFTNTASSVHSRNLPPKLRRQHPSPDVIALVKNLSELLPVYDHILAEEYDPATEKLRHIFSDYKEARLNAPFTCNFCGCDIFQSYFDCRKCFGKLVRESNSDSDAIHICPGCYVEGRSCECFQMRPMQYQSFAHLVNIRTNAVIALNLYRKTFDKGGNVGDLNIEDPTVPHLFQAGCKLRESIMNSKLKSKEKKCSVEKHSQGSHYANRHWILRCDSCHSGKCFAHILAKYKVHSAEAVLVHGADTSKVHEEFHRLHLAGKNTFNACQDKLYESQMRGERPPGYSQLIHNALTFRNCVPLLKGLIGGWYDNEQLLEEKDEDSISRVQTPTPSRVASVSDSETGKQNTTSSSNSLANLKAHPISGAEVEIAFNRSQSRKRKRMIMFVDIPPAPYPIPCSLKSAPESDDDDIPLAKHSKITHHRGIREEVSMGVTDDAEPKTVQGVFRSPFIVSARKNGGKSNSLASLRFKRSIKKISDSQNTLDCSSITEEQSSSHAQQADNAIPNPSKKPSQFNKTTLSATPDKLSSFAHTSIPPVSNGAMIQTQQAMNPMTIPSVLSTTLHLLGTTFLEASGRIQSMMVPPYPVEAPPSFPQPHVSVHPYLPPTQFYPPPFYGQHKSPHHGHPNRSKPSRHLGKIPPRAPPFYQSHDRTGFKRNYSQMNAYQAHTEPTQASYTRSDLQDRTVVKPNHSRNSSDDPVQAKIRAMEDEYRRSKREYSDYHTRSPSPKHTVSSNFESAPSAPRLSSHLGNAKNIFPRDQPRIDYHPNPHGHPPSLPSQLLKDGEGSPHSHRDAQTQTDLVVMRTSTDMVDKVERLNGIGLDSREDMVMDTTATPMDDICVQEDDLGFSDEQDWEVRYEKSVSERNERDGVGNELTNNPWRDN